MKNAARVLNPTFHPLAIQTGQGPQFSTRVSPRGTHMVIMSGAFVFLNCDIGAESAIREEMRDIITCVSKTMASHSL